MSGDYSRFSFDPRRNYSAVLQQQGHILTDSDWNEQSEIARRNLRAALVDVLGRVFVATPGAFKIDSDGRGGLTIGRGRLYVDGLVAENHGAGRPLWDAALDEPYGEDPVSYAQQPFLPDAPALPKSGGPYVVFLDVWQREVTAIEDPGLAEPALGGPDTTTRLQTVWQVKLGAAGSKALCNPPAGRLSTAPGGYQGLENRLYRVEIHAGGEAGRATFKWSRDNGSTAARVFCLLDPSRIVYRYSGPDPASAFGNGSLIEITDDAHELGGRPGELRRIKTVDHASSTLTLDAPLPPGLFAIDATGTPDAARHMRIVRWDGSGIVQTSGTSVAVEDGVAVTFDTDPAGGCFRTGDYWLIPARGNDASIGALERAPPRGIHHHVVRLALFTPPRRLRDCREGVRRRAKR